MRSLPATRYSLILRLRDREDADAWNQFIEIYEPIVHRMMLGAGLQSADAIEQTQEVMAAVAEAINRWTPDANKGKFRTWLYRVSRNLLADFWKQSQRTPRTGVNEETLELAADRVDASFDTEFERHAFLVAAKQVKPRVEFNTWQAFWQTAVEHRAVEDVARDLGMNPGAVYVARSRIMKKLQDAVRSFLKSKTKD